MLEYAGSFWVIVKRGTTQRLVADVMRSKQYANDTVVFLDHHTPGFKLRAEVREVEVSFNYKNNKKV